MQHTYNNAGTYTVTVTATFNNQTTSSSTTFTLTQACTSILSSVAGYIANSPSNVNNPNSIISDAEMLQALRWWYNSTIVPGTCNQSINTASLTTIVGFWINGLSVN